MSLLACVGQRQKEQASKYVKVIQSPARQDTNTQDRTRKEKENHFTTAFEYSATQDPIESIQQPPSTFPRLITISQPANKIHISNPHLNLLGLVAPRSDGLFDILAGFLLADFAGAIPVIVKRGVSVTTTTIKT